MKMFRILFIVAIATFFMVSNMYAEPVCIDFISKTPINGKITNYTLDLNQDIPAYVHKNSDEFLADGNFTLSYLPDDVKSNNAMGITSGSADWKVMVYFPDMEYFNGYGIKQINDIQFSILNYPQGGVGELSNISKCAVIILAVNAGQVNTSEPLVQQDVPVSALKKGWNTAVLTTPFQIPNSVDGIMIGYTLAFSGNNVFPIDMVTNSGLPLGLNYVVTSSFTSSEHYFLIRASASGPSFDYQNNACFLRLEVPPYLAPNTPFKFVATISNRGPANSKITSMELTYKLGNESPVTINASGLNIAPGQSINLNSPDITIPSHHTPGNTYPIEVTISKVNGVDDDDPTDNTQASSYTVPTFIPKKRVLGEEPTGTWCGWCPRGMVAMEDLKNSEPDKWIGIAVHNGDPMANVEYDNAFSQIRGANSYPGPGMIDRNSKLDPGSFKQEFNKVKDAFGVADISSSNYSWNENTRLISFDAKAKFAVPIQGKELRFLVVITEDSVTGTASGYGQANYYAGGASGPMGGFENKPSTVPASQMVYNDVARAALTTPYGVSGSLPSNIAMDSEHTYSFVYTVPTAYNYNKLNVIIILINQTDGGIVYNAAKADKNVSIKEEYVLINSIFPNPVKDNLTIDLKENAKVSIWSIDGNLLYDSEHIEGVSSIKLNASAGTYILRTENKNGSHSTKFVIE